jgi:hypothetical protein
MVEPENVILLVMLALALVFLAGCGRPLATEMSSPLLLEPVAGPEEAAILAFEAQPAEVLPGEVVTLTWRTEGGSGLDLTSQMTGGLPAEAPEIAGPAGSVAIPIDEDERYWRSFSLSLEAGEVITARETLTVTLTCPYDYFFEEQLDVGSACPGGPPVETFAAEQAFEGGDMLWLEEERLIFVLYDDGTYEVYEDTFVEGEPETDPDIEPPASMWQPTRGFGKVWREHPQVREQLGWAWSQEVGFDTVYQRGWRPHYHQEGMWYLSNLRGQVAYLYPDGWEWILE